MRPTGAIAVTKPGGPSGFTGRLVSQQPANVPEGFVDKSTYFVDKGAPTQVGSCQGLP